jgi:hypothetical protein
MPKKIVFVKKCFEKYENISNLLNSILGLHLTFQLVFFLAPCIWSLHCPILAGIRLFRYDSLLRVAFLGIQNDYLILQNFGM